MSASIGISFNECFGYHRIMDAAPNIAAIGALIGDSTRAVMLTTLLDGRALTASELARSAGVTPQTASTHLSKLVSARLLSLESQGRHRYYQLATPQVAQALESLMNLSTQRQSRPGVRPLCDDPLREARTCYDHLAGRVGVSITDALLKKRYLMAKRNDFEVTASGAHFLTELGIDLKAVRRERRAFARKCLDWSERRHHIAGALGAALTERLVKLKWLRQVPNSRVVTVTTSGKRSLQVLLGLST
ncbi:MAG: ArsR/SmtB family transcription factor [Acidiferrobacterales bacterium]